MAAAPAFSHFLQKSRVFLFVSSFLIFTVTGRPHADAESIILITVAGFFKSAEPAPVATTFFTGQAQFISIYSIKSYFFAIIFAASPISFGVYPKIWTP